MAPLIRAEGLGKTYRSPGGVALQALHGLDLEIGAGEFVAIMGHSGSGKSTLLNILGCLDTPSGGCYWLAGQDVARLGPDRLAQVRSRTIGFVFQGFNLLPRMSALDNVALPMLYAGTGRGEANRRARALLEQFGLGEHLRHLPSQLSGGQQQRVAICRALANSPPLLLADEPTGNLDTGTSDEIMAVLGRLNTEQGITVLLITHEADVARHARRLVRIADGRVVHDGEVDC